MKTINSVSSTMLILVFGGCAYYSKQPLDSDVKRSKCEAPLQVEATAIQYSNDDVAKDVTVRVARSITIDSDTDPKISKENPLDENIIQILKKTSSLTGCRFSLSPTSTPNNKIIFSYITNSNRKKTNDSWLYLSAATLGIFPSIYKNENTLRGEIQINSKKKQLNYVNNTSAYLGIIFLPLMPFASPLSYGTDYFATNLANDLCEISSECNAPKVPN